MNEAFSHGVKCDGTIRMLTDPGAITKVEIVQFFEGMCHSRMLTDNLTSSVLDQDGWRGDPNRSLWPRDWRSVCPVRVS